VEHFPSSRSTGRTPSPSSAWRGRRSSAHAPAQALKAITLREHGHAAYDDARYVPAELRGRFADPIERLAARLLADRLPEEDVDAVKASAAAEVAAALEEVDAAPAPDPSTLEECVYATPLE
jgi:TPP-dependent pyruvate/acetoin dehydrogenase alpha subunit